MDNKWEFNQQQCFFGSWPKQRGLEVRFSFGSKGMVINPWFFLGIYIDLYMYILVGLIRDVLTLLTNK